MIQKDSKEPKFKHTRELVRIALNEGMTQAEIARLCRTQQSVVSHWGNGSSKARQSQIAPLIQQFGHKLNRSTSRVYYVEDPPDPNARWEDTERAKKLLALEKVEARDEKFRAEFVRLYREINPWPHPGVGPENLDVDWLVNSDRENFSSRPANWRVVVVEGPVVFRHVFTFPTEAQRGQQVHLTLEPFRRVIVHLHEPNHLVAVWQWRRSLTGTALASWREFGLSSYRVNEPLRVFAHDDAARWTSKVRNAMAPADFIADFDAKLGLGTERFSPHDRATAPFLLRKALIERGFDVPGVERIVPQL